MAGSKSTTEPLGQILGLLILFGIVALKFVIIFLDKKWHSKVHENLMIGIGDLPPLYSGQDANVDVADRQFNIPNDLSMLSHQKQTCFENHWQWVALPRTNLNSNWMLSKRTDFSNGRNIVLSGN